MHKTLGKVRDYFYCSGLRENVENWCCSFQDYAESKALSSTSQSPVIPMERVALDLFGPLPVTKQDISTPWLSLITLTEAYSLLNQVAATVARVLTNR